MLSDLQTLHKILSGCGSAADYLALIPLLGDAAGKVVKGAKKIDNLDDVRKKADDIDNNKPRNEINCANSFVAGTEVLTSEGLVNIEDVEVGDWVIADDPNTVGEIESKRVLALFTHSESELIDLVVDSEIISVTPDHEFWVVDKGWISAEDLVVGSLLQTSDGRVVDVDGISSREGRFEVFNFEVEDFHSYFVSDWGVLVHNISCDGNPISVDDALEKAKQFLEPDIPMRFVDSVTGVQVIQTFTDAQGKTITRRVGFDLNPNTPHVQQLGPHLNLQTQINGKVQGKNTPLADPHIPIDSSTIRQGDF
jgi:hypothetical protein